MAPHDEAVSVGKNHLEINYCADHVSLLFFWFGTGRIGAGKGTKHAEDRTEEGLEVLQSIYSSRGLDPATIPPDLKFPLTIQTKSIISDLFDKNYKIGICYNGFSAKDCTDFEVQLKLVEPAHSGDEWHVSVSFTNFIPKRMFKSILQVLKANKFFYNPGDKEWRRFVSHEKLMHELLPRLQLSLPQVRVEYDKESLSPIPVTVKCEYCLRPLVGAFLEQVCDECNSLLRKNPELEAKIISHQHLLESFLAKYNPTEMSFEEMFEFQQSEEYQQRQKHFPDLQEDRFFRALQTSGFQLKGLMLFASLAPRVVEFVRYSGLRQLVSVHKVSPERQAELIRYWRRRYNFNLPDDWQYVVGLSFAQQVGNRYEGKVFDYPTPVISHYFKLNSPRVVDEVLH